MAVPKQSVRSRYIPMCMLGRLKRPGRLSSMPFGHGQSERARKSADESFHPLTARVGETKFRKTGDRPTKRTTALGRARRLRARMAASVLHKITGERVFAWHDVLPSFARDRRDVHA